MGHQYVKEPEVFTTSQNGTVPKPSAQDVTDGKYLKADGTWDTPSGGGGGAVTSVNGQTGAVVLDADDVGALPDSTTIPTALSDLSDDSTHRVVTDTEKSTWNGKSDFSGSYNDLTDKPTIPAAQVNSDWNAVSGVAEILNKPPLSIVDGKLCITYTTT